MPIDKNLEDKEYLIGDFSAADIMLGHALFMSNKLGCVGGDMSNIKNYLKKIEKRSSFNKAINT